MSIQKEIYSMKKRIYQSFPRLNIRGDRDIEERIKVYMLFDYINKNDNVLVIGSNEGFLDIELSYKCKYITSVEINDINNKIHKRVLDYLSIDNNDVHTSSFQDFTTDDNFSFIICTAVHRYILTDMSIEDYVEKIDRLLKQDGIFLFESHQRNKHRKKTPSGKDRDNPLNIDVEFEIIKDRFLDLGYDIIHSGKSHEDTPHEREYIYIRKL